MKIRNLEFTIQNSKKGFTLIELLVAMAIIGILATVGLGAFFTSQLKGRDARRKQDLGQIQKAMEMYFNDKGVYPPTGDIVFGARWQDTSGELYMKEVPRDPKWNSGATYLYNVAGDSKWYRLYARIENENDLCFTADPNACNLSGHAGTNCGGGASCNYRVSSPNAP